ncbi:FtsX-like permease family protein [Streptomyces sp. NPDC093707]|uniref:FtsX-like permease family protein n=1 Tax=Streptomyces sp. NPDC093707 TaxID=3154984 RepID=UPI00344EFA6D
MSTDTVKTGGGPRGWARDLAMGIRFAVGGGREGWIRTLLTALGVGLGVTLLLSAASVPTIMEHRSDRQLAKALPDGIGKISATPSTLLVGTLQTTYRGRSVSGKFLQPDGPKPSVPPGLAALPKPNEMVLSPALRELLHSPDGALLRERLPYKDVGLIGDTGLAGPAELAFYAGTRTLSEETGYRIATFGIPRTKEALNPLLLTLIIVALVVLLMPVAIFISTAVRFGGERRDRRLAALRLIGADARMTRRTAAGEALFGALCGLLVGAGLFLGARQLVARITLWDVSAFPSDVSPAPLLAALIVLAVPLCAVMVTLLSLRRVAIEPLGVVRNTAARRRRLWWRLPFLLVGAALLITNGSLNGAVAVNPYLVAGGAALFLLGVTLLLPWAVDAAVTRLRGGTVPWQLAMRRLQLSSGAAARSVSGITVAIAGAIALQLLFAGVQGDFMKTTGQDAGRAQLQGSLPARDIDTIRTAHRLFRETEGVSGVVATINTSASRPGPLRKGEEDAPYTGVTYGDCASLGEMAHLGSCKDGDVFLVRDDQDEAHGNRIVDAARPGAAVDLAYHSDDLPPVPPRLWTVPKSARTVDSRPDPMGQSSSGLFVTPGALDAKLLDDPMGLVMIKLAPGVPDAAEHVRNTAARINPVMNINEVRNVERDAQFTGMRTWLLAGSTATLVLIAASMLVTTLEQLRERRRLLSVLVAFGTRRATLAWSVLWQTAIPVVLGLLLALTGGCALGLALLRMSGKTTFDWSVLWAPTAIGAALVVLVTLLSLPPLWRMMRPDGLRTE